jgi:rare lipoprotein A
MKKILTIVILSTILSGCAITEKFFVDHKKKEYMIASWYKHGTRTANGEKYDYMGMTAAHKKLPFGTKLRLTRGDQSVIVRVNDRGPFIKGRDIDLSMGAAKALGCLRMGVCTVEYILLTQ